MAVQFKMWCNDPRPPKLDRGSAMEPWDEEDDDWQDNEIGPEGEPLSGHAKAFLDDLSNREECEMIGGPMDGQVTNLPPRTMEIEWKDTDNERWHLIYRRSIDKPEQFTFVGRRKE